VISEEAGRAMSVISGIGFCKEVEPDFWVNCVSRIVWDLDEAGHQDRVREIREMLYQAWKVLPDKASVTRCNRCEMLPGEASARSICGDCDDVMLCHPCYELHAREVFDAGREQDAALAGLALLRFEAAAEVVIRVAARDMASRRPRAWQTSPMVWIWLDPDRGPGGHARDEPRPGVARPGGGDPAPGAEAEGA
jgi:hypothetical protein